MQTKKFDIVIIGAGSTGAAAACFLSAAGYRVALLEARRLKLAGARWVNGIPPWIFSATGLDQPAPPESRDGQYTFSVLGKLGGGVTHHPCPMVHVDMRHLVARLQSLALEQGTTPFERVRIRDVCCQAERPVGLVVDLRSDGNRNHTIRFDADLFIDASGIRGALLRRLPGLNRVCPPPSGRQICFAAQQVCEIKDRNGALDFLHNYRGQPNHSLNWTGIAGGFSTLTIHMDDELETVDLLTGSVFDGTHPTGPQMMQALLQREPWIGKRIFGGAGLIPIRRPYARLGSPGVALLGDAGCQVFPLHASGVGGGMVAAKTLSETVAKYDDCGSLPATWDYQATFMRQKGSVHGAYDAIRSLTVQLSEEQVAKLVGRGFITRNTVCSGLDQRMPSLPEWGDLLQATRGTLRHPRLAARFAPCVARFRLLYDAYKNYPLNPNTKKLRTWARLVGQLVGEPADM